MDKRIGLAFSLLFFLVIPAIVLATPLFESEVLEVANNSEYNPAYLALKYSFQIKINDSGTAGTLDNVTTVLFGENFNGTSGNTSVSNNTDNIYYINYTFPTNISLADTLYTYTWYAKNGTATENSTSSTYYIAKNTTTDVRMNLTVYATSGTQTNLTDSGGQSVEGQGDPYVDAWMYVADGTGLPRTGTTLCYRDGTAWTKGSTGATSLGTGSYTVKCNSTGNTNYTDNTTGASFTLTVLASGGGGGGGGVPTITTIAPIWDWQPSEDWQLPEMDQNTVIILVIIGIAILVTRKKK